MTSTTLKNNIKKYFWRGLVAILVLIIIFQRCNRDVITPDETKTTVDTIWKTHVDTLVKIVPIYKEKLIYPKGEQYQSSENIDTCQLRFNQLLKDYATARVYQDTIKLDDILDFGEIIIKDTVWTNKLGERQVFRNIKLPEINTTTTITKIAPSKRQLYAGGLILGNASGINSINPGLLYKDRKDRIYSLNAEITFNGDIYYGGGLYWKFDLNKKK